MLEDFYAELRRCRSRCDGRTTVDHRTDEPHECRVVRRHRRPPGRPPAAGYPEHDCDKAGCAAIECPPHECRPLPRLTIRHVHFAISAALSAAVRWDCIKANASVHLSKETEEWLAKQRGRVVFHFTPTGASWMNQIEIWNGIITRKLIRCGTFSSVKALNKAIESFVEHWNSDCGPIAWPATAEEILDKVRTVTSRMEALLRATEIDDVARRAA